MPPVLLAVLSLIVNNTPLKALIEFKKHIFQVRTNFCVKLGRHRNRAIFPALSFCGGQLTILWFIRSKPICLAPSRPSSKTDFGYKFNVRIQEKFIHCFKQHFYLLYS